jgi:hypothetical protein
VGAGLDCDDTLRADVDPFRRITQEHRQGAGDDDEDFFLRFVGVAAAASPCRIAPDTPARLLERRGSRHVSGPARGLTLSPGRPLFPLQLRCVRYVVAHGRNLKKKGRSPQRPSVSQLDAS